MRSVDTIARLYATSGRPLRKLLLSEILSLPGGDPGSPELLAIVHHEAEAGPTVLRRHARWTLGVVLRGFVAESHGLPHDAGWPPPAALVDPWERQTRKLAEIYLSGESLQRLLASVTIGLWPSKAAVDRLWQHLEEKGASFAALASLVESGDADSQDPVVELITQNAVTQPDLLLLLSRLPLAAGLAIAQTLWDKLDVYGQGHIAWALGSHPLQGVREFARASLASTHPFLLANALISAARWADATLGDQIAQAALRVEHAWVRRSALRALAALPTSPATTTVALHWLAKGDRLAQVEALELLRTRRDEAGVVDQVKGYLANSDYEVRAAALAALPPAERDADKVTALMLSPLAEVRRRALEMFAEASGARAIEVMAQAAREDPSKRVRRWAVVELAAAGGEDAVRALAALSDSQYAEVRDAVAQALPRVRGLKPAAILELLMATSGEAVATRMVSVIGTLAAMDPTLGVPEPLTAALNAHEPRLVSSALRALWALADRVDRRHLFPLLAHEDEAVRRRTAALLALSGEAGALWGMVERADPRSEEVGHILRTVMEAGALLGASARLQQAAMLVCAPPAAHVATPPSKHSRREEHLFSAQVASQKFKKVDPEVSPIAAEFSAQADGRALAGPASLSAASGAELDLDQRSTDDASPASSPGASLPLRKPTGASRPSGAAQALRAPAAVVPLASPAGRRAPPVPVLAAIGAAVLAVAILMRPTTPSEPPRDVGVKTILPGPPELALDEFAMEKVDGFVTVGDSPAHAEPLRKRRKLRYGELLESDATGSAVLVDKPGNRIVIGPKSRVLVAAEAASGSRGARPRFILVDPEGDVTIDARAAGDVPLSLNGRTVALSRAIVHVASAGPERVLSVRGGDITYYEPAGAVLRARTGFRLSLDAGGKAVVEKDAPAAK